jgi:hypothetical protein
VFDKVCEVGRRASSRSAPAADIRAEQPAVAEVEEPSICAEMTRTDSYSLGEFPLDVVRIECERCGRAGRYRLAGLIERFGPDAALPDVLIALATCDRRRDFSKPCGARFTDLAART